MEQLLGTSWDVYLGVTVVLAGWYRVPDGPGHRPVLAPRLAGGRL